jgi:hypothetical protein
LRNSHTFPRGRDGNINISQSALSRARILGADVHSILASACCFLVLSSAGAARQLTGTVYSNHSGPSAGGTGEVTLATRLGLISIHYQKPISGTFPNDRCWQLGAIWTVRTEEGRGAEELTGVKCDGTVDAPINAAWAAVREYIKTTARRAGQELGFQADRRGPIIVTIGRVDVDVSGYLNFPNAMCLEMKQRVSNSAVVIASSSDCYFGPEIDFRVERRAASTWMVSNVESADAR